MRLVVYWLFVIGRSLPFKGSGPRVLFAWVEGCLFVGVCDLGKEDLSVRAYFESRRTSFLIGEGVDCTEWPVQKGFGNAFSQRCQILWVLTGFARPKVVGRVFN